MSVSNQLLKAFHVDLVGIRYFGKIFRGKFHQICMEFIRKNHNNLVLFLETMKMNNFNEFLIMNDSQNFQLGNLMSLSWLNVINQKCLFHNDDDNDDKIHHHFNLYFNSVSIKSFLLCRKFILS